MERFNHPSATNTRPAQKHEQLNRSTTRGGISWKKALAISALPLALLFGAAFQSSNSVPGQLQAILAQIASLAEKGPRKFYLTQTTHTGDQVLSACAPGYHTASMWEILDPTDLRYNTDLGLTLTDSGSGPPNVFGWIRTGNGPNGIPFVGLANCVGWTLPSGSNGTIVSLPSAWIDAGTTTSPWTSLLSSCSTPTPVWCVQD